MATENDFKSLLNYDPASVAIRAANDREALQKLRGFAESLLKYVNLVQQQTGADVASSAPVAAVAAVTPPSRAAALVTPQRQQEHATSSTNRIVEEATASTALVAVKTEEESSADNEHRETEEEVIPDEIVSQDDEELQQWNVGSSGGRKRLREEEEVEEETAADEEQRGEGKTAATTAFASAPPESEERRPHKLARGHSGSLKTSELRRSVGKTRTTLNKHLRELGLTSPFAVSAISKKGQKVSHVTLNTKWNLIPKNETEPLEWWLGEGPSRLNLASPLDPSQFEQSARGIPIFWACPPTKGKGGGDRCHYIGHYRCVEFQRFATPILVKDKARQALIGFQFVRFNETMAERIAELSSI